MLMLTALKNKFKIMLMLTALKNKFKIMLMLTALKNKFKIINLCSVFYFHRGATKRYFVAFTVIGCYRLLSVVIGCYRLFRLLSVVIE
jgi:type III secretory pathway component EscU